MTFLAEFAGAAICNETAGVTSTHVGGWTLTNGNLCKLNTTNNGTSSFKEIQFQSPQSALSSNANEKGYVYTVKDVTPGDVKFQCYVFEKLNGGNNFAAPLIVQSVTTGKVEDNQGAKAGDMFADVSLNLGNYIFDGNMLLNGSSNTVLTKNEEVVFNSVRTSCVGQVVISGHDYAQTFISRNGASCPELTKSCDDNSLEGKPNSNTEISMNSMQALEGDNEKVGSSSSSLHEGREERI